MDILSDPRWTDAQREFLRSLAAAGATRAEHAVPVDRASPLPARELQVLVDRGVVREAAANGYYVYQRQATDQLFAEDQNERVKRQLGGHLVDRVPSRTEKVVKVLVFWIIIILIPIVLLNLIG